MEVASPLTFAPAPAGTKRSLVCSPQFKDTPNHGSLDMELEDTMQRTAKRRRFNVDTSIESLSSAFSSHSPFFASNPMAAAASKSSLPNTTAGHNPLFKRLRADSKSPVQEEDLKSVVDEQAAVIESLKKDKTNLESTVSDLKSDNERLVKENQLLRKAVTIQQERHNNTENELKVAQQYGANADEQIKKLEQVILTLRYHLQTQQPSHGNDFMGMPPRPPDVF